MQHSMPQKIHKKRYLITTEVFNAITHGIGFGLSVAGLILLLIKGAREGSALAVVSYAIYGSSLIFLFLFSTLFHSLVFTKAFHVFQVFDHASIFLLIAGSYTPYCLLVVRGWLGWTLFGVIWAAAIAGIVYKSLTLKKHFNPKVSTVIYIIMGWCCLFAFRPLYTGLGPVGFWLLVGGGVTYSLGAAIYGLSKKNFPLMHVVWHLFVLAAAIMMWFSIYLYS